MKLSYSKNGEGDVYTLAQTTYFPIHCLFSSGPRATAARLFRRVSALFFASPYDTDAIRFLQLITDATLKFPPTVSDDDLDSIQVSLSFTYIYLLFSFLVLHRLSLRSHSLPLCLSSSPHYHGLSFMLALHRRSLPLRPSSA